VTVCVCVKHTWKVVGHSAQGYSRICRHRVLQPVPLMLQPTTPASKLSRCEYMSKFI